jgi:hypothetical protein
MADANDNNIPGGFYLQMEIHYMLSTSYLMLTTKLAWLGRQSTSRLLDFMVQQMVNPAVTIEVVERC